MLTVEETESIRPMVRSVQIICSAMVLGPSIFMAIAIVVVPRLGGAGAMPPVARQERPAGAPEADDLDDTGGALTGAAVVCAAVMLLLSFALPRLMSARSLRTLAPRLKHGEMGTGDVRRPVPSYHLLFITATGLVRYRPPPSSAPSGVEERQDDVRRLALLYMRRSIIGGAPCEGAAFFALVVHLTGGRSITVATAALMIIAIAARFPTRGRAENWIERERESLFSSRNALEQAGRSAPSPAWRPDRR